MQIGSDYQIWNDHCTQIETVKLGLEFGFCRALSFLNLIDLSLIKNNNHLIHIHLFDSSYTCGRVTDNGCQMWSQSNVLFSQRLQRVFNKKYCWLIACLMYFFVFHIRRYYQYALLCHFSILAWFVAIQLQLFHQLWKIIRKFSHPKILHHGPVRN